MPSPVSAAYKRQDAFLNKVYRRILPRVARKSFALRNPRPIVSFTFDDFPASAIRTGGPILRKYGAPATYYVAMGQMRPNGGDGGGFDPEDLKAVAAQGHELACHTYSHIDCALTPPAAIARDIDRNAASLAEVLPGYRMTSFAYPYGNLDLASKRLMAGRFDTARGIWTGINSGTADLALLSAHKIYGETANYDRAVELIGETARSGGWLIFFTHDVEENPGPWGSTPAGLERVVRAAAESGGDILTVRDAAAAAGVRSG